MATILIAEDEPHVSRILARALAAEGWRAVECRTGDEVLAQLDLAHVDVMISDSSLRTSEGVGLIELISTRPEFGRLPIVLYSAMDPTRGVDLALSGVVDTFLPKPAPIRDVVSAVKDLIGLGAAFEPMDEVDVLVVSPEFDRWASEVVSAGWVVEATPRPVIAMERLRSTRVRTVVVDLALEAPRPEALARIARRVWGQAGVRVIGVGPMAAVRERALFDLFLPSDATTGALRNAIQELR